MRLAVEVVALTVPRLGEQARRGAVCICPLCRSRDRRPGWRREVLLIVSRTRTCCRARGPTAALTRVYRSDEAPPLRQLRSRRQRRCGECFVAIPIVGGLVPLDDPYGRLSATSPRQRLDSRRLRRRRFHPARFLPRFGAHGWYPRALNRTKTNTPSRIRTGDLLRESSKRPSADADGIRIDPAVWVRGVHALPMLEDPFTARQASKMQTETMAWSHCDGTMLARCVSHSTVVNHIGDARSGRSVER